MNHVIVLYWKATSLQALVLRGSSSNLELEAAIDVLQQDSSTEAGRILAEKLASYSPSRAAVVVAVGRDLLRWQHLSLPPCPEDDLPDLVRLQADYASNGGSDPVGLDFLPLAGDENSPHRVWTISVSPTDLARLRKTLAAAELEVDRMVPAVLGWPQLIGSQKQTDRGMIFVAPSGEEPAIWAVVDGKVVVFRQLHLPAPDSEQYQPAVVGEVKRTVLAFSQEHPEVTDPVVAVLNDESPLMQRLFDGLSEKLDREVRFVQAETALAHDGASGSILQPLFGIASSAMSGTSPLVDLLHPRQRPAPKTRRQTYYLAGAAVLALVLLVGWKAYRDLQAPLEHAAEMQAEVDLRNESKETLADAEKNAAAIRAWEGKTVNLLDELRTITREVRPEPLDSENFPEDDDYVVGKVEMRDRQFTITLYTKQNSDLRPVEYRLRDGIHRVRRGVTERSDEISGYPVKFETIVDVLSSASPSEDEGGNP